MLGSPYDRLDVDALLRESGTVREPSAWRLLSRWGSPGAWDRFTDQRSGIGRRAGCEDCGEIFVRDAYRQRRCADCRAKRREPRPCSDCGETFKPRKWNQIRCRGCVEKWKTEHGRGVSW